MLGRGDFVKIIKGSPVVIGRPLTRMMNEYVWSIQRIHPDNKFLDVRGEHAMLRCGPSYIFVPVDDLTPVN